MIYGEDSSKVKIEQVLGNINNFVIKFKQTIEKINLKEADDIKKKAKELKEVRKKEKEIEIKQKHAKIEISNKNVSKTSIVSSEVERDTIKIYPNETRPKYEKTKIEQDLDKIRKTVIMKTAMRKTVLKNNLKQNNINYDEISRTNSNILVNNNNANKNSLNISKKPTSVRFHMNDTNFLHYPNNTGINDKNQRETKIVFKSLLKNKEKKDNLNTDTNNCNKFKIIDDYIEKDNGVRVTKFKQKSFNNKKKENNEFEDFAHEYKEHDDKDSIDIDNFNSNSLFDFLNVESVNTGTAKIKTKQNKPNEDYHIKIKSVQSDFTFTNKNSNNYKDTNSDLDIVDNLGYKTKSSLANNISSNLKNNTSNETEIREINKDKNLISNYSDHYNKNNILIRATSKDNVIHKYSNFEYEDLVEKEEDNISENDIDEGVDVELQSRRINSIATDKTKFLNNNNSNLQSIRK